MKGKLKWYPGEIWFDVDGYKLVVVWYLSHFDSVNEVVCAL